MPFFKTHARLALEAVVAELPAALKRLGLSEDLWFSIDYGSVEDSETVLELKRLRPTTGKYVEYEGVYLLVMEIGIVTPDIESSFEKYERIEGRPFYLKLYNRTFLVQHYKGLDKTPHEIAEFALNLLKD